MPIALFTTPGSFAILALIWLVLLTPPIVVSILLCRFLIIPRIQKGMDAAGTKSSHREA